MNCHHAALRGRAHDQLPTLRHRLLGVDDQVQQRLPKRLAIEHHARQFGIEIPHDLDAGLRGFRREELEHVVDLVVQIRRLQMQPPHLGEVQKIIEQRLQPLAFAPHDFHPLQRPPTRRRFRLGQILGQQLHVQPNRRQRILDLVRKTAGQLGDLGVLVHQPLDRGRGIIQRRLPLSVAESPYASL